MSSESGWNISNGTEDGRQKRFKKKRKRRSDLTEDEDEDTEDSEEAVFPIIIGAVCAGVVVFLCLISGPGFLCTSVCGFDNLLTCISQSSFV